MNCVYRSLLIALLVIPGPVAVPATAADQGGYRVGDRLQHPARAKPARTKAAKDAYQEIGWDALVPEDWNPAKAFKGIDLSRLDDGDSRAMDALAQLKKAWDSAPVEPGWDGQRIRIPGFVVPLERNQDRVTEFLLVPYFGACIHVPPPPANQIIHVFPATPIKNMRTMDAVWVVGVLATTRSEAEKESEKRMGMGTAGYRMTGESIAPYKGR